MKKQILILVLSISIFACKNDKKNDVINETEEVLTVLEKEDIGVNLTKNVKVNTKYADELPFKIDSVYLKEVDNYKYELRAYLSGDYDSYDGPSYPFYLRFYPNSTEIEYLPENRRPSGYENLHFAFKVNKDNEGKPYVSKVFETQISKANKLILIVTEPVKRSNILIYEMGNVPLFDLDLL